MLILLSTEECGSHLSSRKLLGDGAHYVKPQLIKRGKLTAECPSSKKYIYKTTSTPKAQETLLKRGWNNWMSLFHYYK